MDDFNTYKKPDPKDLPFDPSRRNENDFPESAHETVYSSSDLSFEGSFEEGNRVLEIGKGVIGALIGSIPGIIIWILIGRFGIIASLSGAILAGGVVMGYKFTQKNEVLSKRTGIIICVLVIIFAIHISQKISWCMHLSDFYARYVDDLKDSLYALGELGNMSKDEIDKMYRDTIYETFGFYEGTFGDFYDNFYRVLSAVGAVGKYIGSLIMSICFAAAGSFAMWRRNFYL